MLLTIICWNRRKWHDDTTFWIWIGGRYDDDIVLQTEPDKTTAPSENHIPPILPSQIQSLRPRKLFDIIEMQRKRPLLSYYDYHLSLLNEAYKSFKRVNLSINVSYTHTSPYASQGAHMFKRCCAPYVNRFPTFVQFLGGLATSFRGTPTVESDFWVINYEQNEFRSSLSLLTFDGILNCKELKKNENISHK